MMQKAEENEGTSEIYWFGKLHWRLFQWSKITQCVQSLSDALGSKVMLQSFLLQLPNCLTIFIWGTHLSLTFTSLAL